MSYVGATASELASLVKRACLDNDLNRNLRRGGRCTYDEHFTPSVISRKINSVMEEMVPSNSDNDNIELATTIRS